MQVLLDTHVVLWYLDGEPLPKNVIEILEDEQTARIVSMATFWELSIKISLKKLTISKSLPDLYDSLFVLNLKILPIDFKYINTLSSLPFHHNDPFDRLMIAQAITDDLKIISADRYFEQYPVRVIW